MGARPTGLLIRRAALRALRSNVAGMLLGDVAERFLVIPIYSSELPAAVGACLRVLDVTGEGCSWVVAAARASPGDPSTDGNQPPVGACEADAALALVTRDVGSRDRNGRGSGEVSLSAVVWPVAVEADR